MWGENSVGRKISLLNEDHDLVAQTASSGTRGRERREEGREKREKAGLVSPTLLHTPANTIITNTLITTNTTTSSLLSSSRQRPPLPNRSRQSSSSSSSSASTSDHSSSSSTAAPSSTCTSTSSTASYSAAQSLHHHHHHQQQQQQHHYPGSGSGSCSCCRDIVGSLSSSSQRHPVRPELSGVRKHSSYTSSRPLLSSSCATSYTSSRARSPPTPPLLRLDSSSSSSTCTRRSASSPKTPNDLHELMDPANPKAAAAVAAAGYPYYPSTSRPGTLPLPDHAYYSLPGQQALPPMPPPVDLDDAYASLPAQPFPPSIHPISAAGSAPLALSPTASSPAHSLVTGPGAYYPSAAPSFASMSPTSPQAPVGRPTRTEAASTHNTISKPRAHSPSSNNGTPKKKYPCPHAATFGCHDTFTTSGHAARHGKKHTGEKNVRCPTCGKAFTRKDNMKQHERTHKTGNASHGHASSPTTATARSERGRSRRASEGHGARSADVMDIDSSNASPSISQHPNIHSSPSASSNPSVPTLSNASTLSLSASSSLSPPATNPVLAANPNGQSLERPKMQRSELSEILETYNQTAAAAAAAPLPLDVNTYGIDPAGPNLMSDPSGLAALNLKADPALGATGPLMPIDMDAAGVAGYPTGGTLPPMNGIDAEGDSPGLDALASMAAVAGTHP